MASSKLPIYSALVANLLIAVTKFIAAGITGSSAMVSEGIHSLVDTTNEILLLLGIRRSRKPADAKRPFGYGRELYFWAFIVSVMIFGLGAGISFYEGFTHLQHPSPLKDPFWSYIVLGIAFLFDGISFVIALKAFNKQRGSLSFLAAIKKSKDPSSFAVLLEDAADVAGLLVAFLGVYLGHQLNIPYADGIASVIIGCILTAVSLLLARESRSLLLGESAEKEILDQVIRIAQADEAVVSVLNPRSVYMAPEEIILLLNAAFKKNLNTTDIEAAIKRIRLSIQARFPSIKQIAVEPESLPENE